MNEHGLGQHSKEISRPASNNILDLILTNNPAQSHMYIVPLACQTTMLLFVFLISGLSINDSIREPFLCIAKQIGTTFAQKIKHLSEVNFNRNPDIYPTEDNCLLIQTSIENLMQTLVPSRLSKSKFHVPWITKDVRKQMKSRNKLHVRAIESKSPQD